MSRRRTGAIFSCLVLLSACTAPMRHPNDPRNLPAPAGQGKSTVTWDEQLSGNEVFHRTPPRPEWRISCRDLQAPKNSPPFLTFKVQEQHRIADLRFHAEDPRYLGYGFPEFGTYGPYKGEVVTEGDSPWIYANEYKITDFMHLYLPELSKNVSEKKLGRDRDPSWQNGVIEIEVHSLKELALIRLRCIPL